ncbi:uncharacterized protein LOC144158260 isoform X3 [Haemaphysalis longicornis]
MLPERCWNKCRIYCEISSADSVPKPGPSAHGEFGKDISRHQCFEARLPLSCTKKPGRRFACSFCPYSCNSKANVARHELVHRGERPFVCEVCHKSFRQKGTLDIHRRTHTNERPYACPKCDCRFKDPANFTRHRKRHMDDSVKRYLCHDCGLRYLTKAGLSKHMLTHTEAAKSCVPEVWTE